MYSIRPADRKDLETVCTLWQALMREQEAMDARLRMAPDAARRWCGELPLRLRSPYHAIFVAEREDEVVGFIAGFLLYPVPLYFQQLEAFVGEIYVQPEHRGQGVGTALLETFKAWAARQGAAVLRAEVLAANTASLRFWERHGARPFAVVEVMPLGNPEAPEGR